MKIINFKAENFKRIVAIDITPKGNVVIISGKNGAGKTSAIDSIWSGLQWKAGKKVNKSPIRTGEKFADVKITFEDFIVNRKWLDSDKTYLKVTNREGMIYSSPQELLDKFIGVLSFDPSVFTTMTPKEQRDLFLKIAEVDIDYYDNKIAEIKERRLLKGREVKMLAGEREEITLANLPEVPINVTELQNKYDEAIDNNRTVQDGITDHKAYGIHIENNVSTIEALQGQIEELKKENFELADRGQKITKWLEDHPIIELDGIRQEMSDATKINGQIAARGRNKQKDIRLNTAETEYNKDTEELKSIEENKSKALANSKMKIKGLSIDDSGVLYNGIPFTQISASEQIKICMEIGIALNPEFECIFLRNYTLLDSDSKKVVDELAEKYDYQVICEQVDSTGEVGFYIEEGEVKNEN